MNPTTEVAAKVAEELDQSNKESGTKRKVNNRQKQTRRVLKEKMRQ